MANEGLNRCTMLGNVTQPPELRFTQGNQGVLNLRIACNESYFDKTTNERKETTEYVSVIIWGKRGEALNKILGVGDKILVEGRLQTRSWEDKSGAKRYSTEVVANNVLLLGGKGQGQGGQRAYEKRNAGVPEEGPTSGGASGNWDDSDIPFAPFDAPL